MKSIPNKVVQKFNPYKFCGEFIEENTLMNSITIISYLILSLKIQWNISFVIYCPFSFGDFNRSGLTQKRIVNKGIMYRSFNSGSIFSKFIPTLGIYKYEANII